jgi:hypothetical protein
LGREILPDFPYMMDSAQSEKEFKAVAEINLTFVIVE